MSRIFLSYRRGDTAGHAGRLVDHLRNAFPQAAVFMDVDTIQPGVDFVRLIEDNVAACDVVLVLIGDDWLTATDRQGNRRLENPDDFVRLEVAAALKRNVPVIPVLVEQATMPNAGDLPEELSRLARINALEVADNRWDYDIGRLFTSLESLGLARGTATRAAAPASPDGLAQARDRTNAAPARRNGMRLALLVGVPGLVLAAVLAIVLLGGRGETPRPTPGPLLVEVRTNIDDFDYTGTGHVPEFLTTRPISDVGPPPNVQLDQTAGIASDQNFKGRWAWAHQMGAVDANETLLRVTIQARDDAPVILHAIEVVVLERKPPPAGSNLSYTGLGSAVSPNTVLVDLDQSPPSVIYIDESLDEQRAFTFSVSRTDVQVLNILASTASCDCTWVAKLKYTHAGESGEFTVNDAGTPFRTTATANADHCHWTGSAWSCTKP